MNAYTAFRYGMPETTTANALIPQPGVDFGAYEARLYRAQMGRAYYYNTIYDMLGDNTPNAFVKANRLYKFMRGVYNPVERRNSLIVSYTYRGAINLQNIRAGALPLECDDRLVEPLVQVMKWSNLSQQLGDYVRRADRDGDAFWWIVDDPRRRRVRMELLDAEKVREVKRDEVGNIKAALIEYERFDDVGIDDFTAGRKQQGRHDAAYLYQQTVEKLDSDSIRIHTYRDGEPYDYLNDVAGGEYADYALPFPFVPMVHAYAEEGQDGWGRVSFLGTPRRKIDELNDQASIINDSIRRVIQPVLKATGVTFVDAQGRPTNELSVETDSRTDITVVRISNKDGNIEALTIPLDIAAAAKNRDDMLAELMRDMPVLSLQHIRDNAGNLSGRAIENLFGDAVSSIEDVRKNVDPPMAAGLKMALTIGGIRGYFRGIDAGSYDRGDLEVDIKQRPVIEDALDTLQRMTFLFQVKDQPPSIARLALESLQVDEDDIQKVLADLETQPPADTPNGVNAPNDASALPADVIDLLNQLGEMNGDEQPESAANAV